MCGHQSRRTSSWRIIERWNARGIVLLRAVSHINLLMLGFRVALIRTTSDLAHCGQGTLLDIFWKITAAVFRSLGRMATSTLVVVHEARHNR